MNSFEIEIGFKIYRIIDIFLVFQQILVIIKFGLAYVLQHQLVLPELDLV